MATRSCFEDVGLFPNVVVAETAFCARFASLEEFKHWMKASSHNDLDEMDESSKKIFFEQCVTVDEVGSVTVQFPHAEIVASKIE